MTSDSRVRVVIADDHQLLRDASAEFLRTAGGIDVIGEVSNGAQAVALAVRTHPDVILLGISMPLMNIEDVVVAIRRVSPPSRIVILSMFDDPRLVQDLFNLGASGHISKASTRDELIAVVRAVANAPTHTVLSPPRAPAESIQAGSAVLTRREAEVLLLLCRGMSNRGIAEALTLSEGTVKRHIANMYAKLKVGSRGAAIRRALSEELVELHDIVGVAELPTQMSRGASTEQSIASL
jgi:DNA-binding NarL/FixJ family response regulator